ncbi:MAG: hypothetical protein ACXV3D_00255 [Halobacteriota archaeon]
MRVLRTIGAIIIVMVLGPVLLLGGSFGIFWVLYEVGLVHADPTVSPAATSTPTQMPTATPMATHNAPKATPSTSSQPQRLTQAQLNAGEAALQKRGNTMTQHLHYDHTESDGTLVYLGKMTNEKGYAQNVIIYVYKDFPSATDGFNDAISKLETMGFDGSESRDGYTWTGTMLYHGQAVGGGAVQSSSDSPPYMVTVFFLE